MTKTITELQPMIYGDLFARSKRRAMQRHRCESVFRKLATPIYMAFGTLIVFDAGVRPWDIRFWLIFLPFFVLGEFVGAALSRSRSEKVSQPDDYERVGATLWFEGIVTTRERGSSLPAPRKRRAGRPIPVPTGVGGRPKSEEIALCG